MDGRLKVEPVGAVVEKEEEEDEEGEGEGETAEDVKKEELTEDGRGSSGRSSSSNTDRPTSLP